MSVLVQLSGDEIVYDPAGNPLTATDVQAAIEEVAGTADASAPADSPVLTTPEINDTSSDHQYVFAVSELAADRTITLPLLTTGDTFVFEDHAQTLTNKRVNRRVTSMASSATLPVDSDSFDVAAITALAENLTVAAPSGTPVDGQELTYRIREDGTGSYTVAWNSIFHGPNTGSPTAATTTADNTNIWVFMYNSTDSIWEEVSATVGIA